MEMVQVDDKLLKRQVSLQVGAENSEFPSRASTTIDLTREAYATSSRSA